METNWKPLVAKLGKERCVGFMFMGRVNGINLYKHGIARMYLNLDDSGECYVSCENCRFEKADFDAELRNLEASLTQLGQTLESVYDESYIEQKRQAFERAGISYERIEIQPEDLSIN
jgi:5,10-methylene-tetrahydrofolate dehydrogenase/methenyl tetrahydrofolate cyclohydrolase